mmetsp:Transcript_83578/g.147278  ORF Transcript_83578/g.147278 Transcript_83578/m.147278 type:complete len:341 (-) Transcript_83578:3789-4811(-)
MHAIHYVDEVGRAVELLLGGHQFGGGDLPIGCEIREVEAEDAELMEGLHAHFTIKAPEDCFLSKFWNELQGPEGGQNLVEGLVDMPVRGICVQQLRPCLFVQQHCGHKGLHIAVLTGAEAVVSARPEGSDRPLHVGRGGVGRHHLLDEAARYERGHRVMLEEMVDERLDLVFGLGSKQVVGEPCLVLERMLPDKGHEGGRVAEGGRWLARNLHGRHTVQQISGLTPCHPGRKLEDRVAVPLVRAGGEGPHSHIPGAGGGTLHVAVAMRSRCVGAHEERSSHSIHGGWGRGVHEGHGLDNGDVADACATVGSLLGHTPSAAPSAAHWDGVRVVPADPEDVV